MVVFQSLGTKQLRPLKWFEGKLLKLMEMKGAAFKINTTLTVSIDSVCQQGQLPIHTQNNAYNICRFFSGPTLSWALKVISTLYL